MVQQVCQFLADFDQVVQPGRAPAGAVGVHKVVGAGDDASYEVNVAGKVQGLSIASGVWNPAGYIPLAKAIFTVRDGAANSLSDLECAEALLSPSLTVFVAQNRRISGFLAEHPAAASGHVQAALLVGTIALNDYSGDFRDVRIPLNRMVAHLAAADALGMPASSEGRRLAEALRLTLCGQQADALESLKIFSGASSPALVEWVTILRLRNTCDWREARGRAVAGSDALKHEYFRALVRSVGAGMGLQFLKDAAVKPDAGYWRIANEDSLSVEHGHIFSQTILGIELQEAALGADAFGIKAEKGSLDWFKRYAATPEGSIVTTEAGQAVVQVAGQNLLAGYHQRHVMQAAQKMFGFLNDNWGVSDKANELKAFIEGKLPETRYTVFLNRMLARDNASRMKANVPCEVVIREHPEWVTPTLWSALREDQNKKWVLSPPNHHAWFHPEVPRGTAFAVDDRLYEIGVGDENDGAWLKELLARAPYSYPLARQGAYHENGSSMDNISPEIMSKWLGSLAEFNLLAMRFQASSYKGQPDLYQAAVEKAAKLDPDMYLELGSYLEDLGLSDKAAAAYLQAFEKADDRVRMASKSLSLVKYLYAKGDITQATKVAEEAAQVYSYRGLGAHVWLLEKQGKWQQAVETARKIDERYNDSHPLAEVACILRISEIDQAAAQSLDRAQNVVTIFPAGIKKVDRADFSEAPKRGVLIDGSSKQLVPFGLQINMVIVALNGIRTETFAQYQVVRELADDPHMSLIVWSGNDYRTSEGVLSGRRFGVDMKDYVK